MSLLNLEGDAFNRSMMNGLKKAFEEELTDELMKTAKESIKKIVQVLSHRLEIKLENYKEFETLDRCIKLEWVIKDE